MKITNNANTTIIGSYSKRTIELVKPNDYKHIAVTIKPNDYKHIAIVCVVRMHIG